MDVASVVFLVLIFLVSTLVNITFAGFLALKTGEFIWKKIQKL